MDVDIFQLGDRLLFLYRGIEFFETRLTSSGGIRSKGVLPMISCGS